MAMLVLVLISTDICGSIILGVDIGISVDQLVLVLVLLLELLLLSFYCY